LPILGLVEVLAGWSIRRCQFDLARAPARLAWFRQILSGSVWFESAPPERSFRSPNSCATAADADMALRLAGADRTSILVDAHRTRTREYLVEAANGHGVADDDPRGW